MFRPLFKTFLIPLLSDPSSSEISNIVVEIELLKTNISNLQECVQVRHSRFTEKKTKEQIGAFILESGLRSTGTGLESENFSSTHAYARRTIPPSSTCILTCCSRCPTSHARTRSHHAIPSAAPSLNFLPSAPCHLDRCAERRVFCPRLRKVRRMTRSGPAPSGYGSPHRTVAGP